MNHPEEDGFRARAGVSRGSSLQRVKQVGELAGRAPESEGG